MRRRDNRTVVHPSSFRPFHEMLDRYTYVSVRYKLATQSAFIKSLDSYPRPWTSASWGRTNRALSSKDLVGDASHSDHIKQDVLEREITAAGSSLAEWHAYLCTPFTGENEDWGTELAMRRARQVIAKQFAATASEELAKCYKECATQRNRDSKETRRQERLTIFILLLFISFPFWPRIKEGFTPVDTLTEQIYQHSRYGFNGAICRDGWTSHSQSRGTCSHHGGVSYYFSENDYRMTREQARSEAHKRSWLD